MAPFIIAAALSFVLIGSPGHATQQAPEDLTKWVVANRTELDSLSSEAAKTKIKNFLQDKLAEKKFVYLGEPEHFMHEKWPFRELMMSVLFEMGYTNILNEMGRSDGKAINSYFHSGNEEDLKKVCLWGMCGGATEPTVYGAEELRHYKKLHQLAQKAKVKLNYFGWDADPVPQGGYPAVISALEKAHACPFAKTLLNKLARKQGESMVDEGNRIYEVVKDVNLNKKKLAPCFRGRAYDEFFWDIRTLSDSFKIFGQYYSSYEQVLKDKTNAKAKKEMYQIFLLREPTGFERAQFIIKGFPESAKFILIGHNGHNLKYAAEATNSYKDIQDALPLWRTIGEMIDTNYPGQTFNIWFGAGQGFYGRKGPCDGATPCPAPPVAGTIEEQFVKVSTSPWIVALAQAPLPRLVVHSIHMTNKDQVNMKLAADAYFFVPQTTMMAR